MTNREILEEINRLKSSVKEIIQNIQSLKSQLEQSQISFNQFKTQKSSYENELRALLKKIAQLKETIEFEVELKKEDKEETKELKISQETEKLMYYFQTEFEDFVNKANVYLSGSVDNVSLEMGLIELFYPPVAQRNKPFKATCVAVQRGAENVRVTFNIDHLSDTDPSKYMSDKGILVDLVPQKPVLTTFKIQAQDTHRYSFRAKLKEINNRRIRDFNDFIYYDFEVKILPFFETGNYNDFFQTKTGRYLVYSYLACEKEELEMFQELKEYLKALGVTSFDPLIQIVPGAKRVESLLDLGRRIQETIIFVIDHFKLIQMYQNFEKIDAIEQELLEQTEQLFKFTQEGIIIESLENIENSLQLSMVFRLFFKMCKLGLRKLLLLKTILGIGKEYGYDISKYFIYIKKRPIM